MKLYQQILEKHIQAEKLQKKRDEFALNNFLDKIILSREINMVVQKNSKDRKVKTQSRVNYIINAVTAIEVFIKESIKGKYVYFSNERQKELLKEKITLWEAHELFRTNQIETEDIIAGYYNFQNLDSISYVLSTLTGKDFYKTMNSIKIDLPEVFSNYFKLKTLKLSDDFPNWQMRIKELFEIRHENIHELNFSVRLGKQRLAELIDNLIAFTVILSELFGKTFDEFISEIKKKLTGANTVYAP